MSVLPELRMSEDADARPDREYSYPIKHRPAHAIHRRSALLGLLEVDFSLGCQWTRIVTRLVNPNCYEP